MDPNKDEQETTPAAATPGNDGWSQFGKVPPRTGAYRADGATGPQPTMVNPMPEPFAAGTFGTPAVPAQRGRIGVAKKLGTGLALAAMAVGGGVAGAFAATGFNNDTTVASSSSTLVSPVSRVTTVADVAKAVQPSVVSIQVKTANGGGEGSGVVLSEDGRILTNNHVVEAGGQGGQMTVKFSDGKTATAKIIGTDPTTDLAVIKADNVSGLTKASLGDSDALKVGDYVLAIGSPLGLSGSVTAGIVSALNRTLTVGDEQGPQQQMPPGWPGGQQQLPPGWGGGPGQGGGQDQGGGGQMQQQSSGATTIGGAIQTDASINPGNSGGALVNASGQVVGINTAIATNGGEGSIGVGFSIPINTAKQVAQQLIDSGKVSHAFLGVSVTDATGDAGGALIAQVTDNSPASKAGLKQGDLITKINDTAVEDGNTVVGAVRGFKPGEKVAVSYVRDGQPHTVTVTLAEMAGE
ncbi:putative serine protease PepD [Streptosporangium subroseum]|uniref:Putative serine protease PepD n=1 Tax=Streptosporangium subroseum TaxID=106412 RepID=A0A239N6H7_9ACTN|nr:trypsin-like peptidase domain-containing protein [Streptosporangium subroseum]SNT49788.1 putative serine protease PepD [Streptosporangium subroseum]